MTTESKKLNWFSKQIMMYPIGAGLICIGIPQYLFLLFIGYYQSQILIIVYGLFSIIAGGIYTSYAAYLRGRSKWWGIGLIFGLILISLIGIRGEKAPTLFGFNALQFLSMIGIFGFGGYAMINKSILAALISIAILVLIVWHTKKYK